MTLTTMRQTWTAERLHEIFDATAPLTVGLEEEVFLVDPGTLDLAPVAAEVIAKLPADGRFKPELPAAQLELVSPPCPTVGEAIGVLRGARAELAAVATPIAAAVHPLAAAEGTLNGGERYAAMELEYGPIARRQLVGSLQIHVAVGGAERSLAVYNALRSYLPDLAALAANAPFHEGRDSGLASVRPKICEALPRQGMPPALPSWAAFADALSWGTAAGVIEPPAAWWWELRPHVAYGTLELRVPDTQTTLGEAAAVAATAHALVAWLAARHDAGESLEAAPTWRIAENRWSACRHGVEGTMADLGTGERTATRERLHTLLDALTPTAAELGCTAELESARSLVERNGALRQRAICAEAGMDGVVTWMTEQFSG
jgi:carboxylate-amine ligase